MTLPANIRINVRTAFPSRVKGSGFITVSRANGVFTIKPDYTLLAPASGATATQIIAMFDTLTGTWSYISAVALAATLATQSYRIITAVGAVSVLPTDQTLVFQKGASGASTVSLPTSASRNGTPVTVKDLTGDASTNNITAVPSGAETIDGFSAATAAANGAALINVDYDSKTFFPLQSGGWFTI